MRAAAKLVAARGLSRGMAGGVAAALCAGLIARLEFHYTLKHASWLNMVEIEISVLAAQCLDRRIPDRATLEREIKAWQSRRDASGARIKWMFSVEAARAKLGKRYPPAAEEIRKAA